MTVNVKSVALRLAGVCAIAATVTLHATPAAAQPPADGPEPTFRALGPPREDLPSCDVAKAGLRCLVTIDRQRPQSPGRLRVWNSTTVVVRVANKSPYEFCWSGAAKSSLSNSVTGRDELDEVRDTLRARLALLEANARREGPAAAAALDVVAQIERDVARIAEALRFESEPPPPEADLVRSFTWALWRRENLRTDFHQSRQSTIRLVADSLVDVDRALDQIGKLSVESPGEREQTSRSIISGASADLEVARDVLSRAAAFVQGIGEQEFQTEVTLLGGRNETLSDVVVCANRRTMATTMHVPIDVTYSQRGGTDLSVGLLFSPMQRREFVTEARKGVDGSIEYAISQETAGAPLPFVFVNFGATNFRLAKLSQAMRVSVGLGFDVTGDAATSVHFFAGVSVFQMGGIRLTPGVHLARRPRLGGGFSAEDPVDAGFEPPVSYGWNARPSISVSYQLGRE